MIDDIRDMVKETDKWLENTRKSLDEIETFLELAELKLDDIRSNCSESIEGDVIKCMEYVRKAKYISEDI